MILGGGWTCQTSCESSKMPVLHLFTLVRSCRYCKPAQSLGKQKVTLQRLDQVQPNFSQSPLIFIYTPAIWAWSLCYLSPHPQAYSFLIKLKKKLVPTTNRPWALLILFLSRFPLFLGPVLFIPAVLFLLIPQSSTNLCCAVREVWFPEQSDWFSDGPLIGFVKPKENCTRDSFSPLQKLHQLN